jgi:hypothetical protein
MLHKDSQIFLKSSDFFLKNTQEYTIEYSFFIFISFILQNFAPKKMTHHNMHIWMFPITCHILKELHFLLCMMSALTIFGDGNFIFKFVSYGLMTKPLGIGCTI